MQMLQDSDSEDSLDAIMAGGAGHTEEAAGPALSSQYTEEAEAIFGELDDELEGSLDKEKLNLTKVQGAQGGAHMHPCSLCTLCCLTVALCAARWWECPVCHYGRGRQWAGAMAVLLSPIVP